jgi:hypothetical protein
MCFKTVVHVRVYHVTYTRGVLKMEDKGRLAPLAAKLVDRLAILVAWVLLTLALCALTVMSVCNISFVELLMFLFGVFWADVRR